MDSVSSIAIGPGTGRISLTTIPWSTSLTISCHSCKFVALDSESKLNLFVLSEVNNLEKGKFILGTIHRDNNTDIPERLNEIFEAFYEIANQEEIDIVLPLHPRTSKILKQNLKPELYESVTNSQFIIMIPPASFFDIIVLEKNCRIVMTDSGGVQKEAYFFQKPVIILRPETEWIELVDNGTAMLVDADKKEIIKAFEYYYKKTDFDYPEFYGDGNAADKIIEFLVKSR